MSDLEKAIRDAFWNSDTEELTETERDEIARQEVRDFQDDFRQGRNMALSDVAAVAFKEFDHNDGDVQQAEFFRYVDREFNRYGYF